MRATTAATGAALAPAGKRRRGVHGLYLFALPALLLFVVFIAYPILWVAGQSLYTGKAWAGVDNYRAVLADPTFWIVVRNMALWGVITIPVQMLIGGLLAWFIERHTHRLRGFFRTAFFLPVVTSVSVVSLVWVQIYAPYYGIAQEYLRRIGVTMMSSPIAATVAGLWMPRPARRAVPAAHQKPSRSPPIRTMKAPTTTMKTTRTKWFPRETAVRAPTYPPATFATAMTTATRQTM